MNHSSQYKLTTKSRHLRYLYIIDENYSLEDLKKLILQNQLIWGGRYNPIIPTVDGKISESYTAFLEKLDPDYILYSKSINLDYLYGLGFNPLKYLIIDEPSENTIKGIHINHLVSRLSVSNNFLNPHSLFKVKGNALSFYKINYGCQEETIPTFKLLDGFTKIDVYPKNFNEINKLIIDYNILSKVLLSQNYVSSNILRAKNSSNTEVELIISKGEGNKADYIYFWNRQLYFMPDFKSNQYIISENELKELCDLTEFGTILFKMNYDPSLNVSSLSLNPSELKKIINSFFDPLTSGYVIYKIQPTPTFPYEFERVFSTKNNAYTERSNEHIIINNDVHISENKLSFSNLIVGPDDEWMIDLSFNKKDDLRFNYRLFPNGINVTAITGRTARLLKSHEVSVVLMDNDSKLEFKIKEFDDILSERIINPYINNQYLTPTYTSIRKNDEGKRLESLIRLFSGLDNAKELLSDMFWMELLQYLSVNTKIEGDTVTFDEIVKRCINKMSEEEGIVLNKETYNNLSNLKKGLRYSLQELTEKGIFRTGCCLKCPICSSKFWYSLDDIKTNVECRGCANLYKMEIETPYSYKLNSIIKGNIAKLDKDGKIQPDGNLTVLRTLYVIKNYSRVSFDYSPQVNIFNGNNPIELVGDIDIAVLSDGKFIIGEAKHSSILFRKENKKSLHSLINLAKTLHPDKVILSCIEDNPSGRLEKDKDFVVHHLKSYPNIKVECIQTGATYSNFSSGFFQD